jgi:hypothetical protein
MFIAEPFQCLIGFAGITRPSQAREVYLACLDQQINRGWTPTCALGTDIIDCYTNKNNHASPDATAPHPAITWEMHDSECGQTATGSPAQQALHKQDCSAMFLVLKAMKIVPVDTPNAGSGLNELSRHFLLNSTERKSEFNERLSLTNWTTANGNNTLSADSWPYWLINDPAWDETYEISRSG